MKEKPTFGESYIAVKNSIKLVDGEWKSIKLPKHREKMNKHDASKYYGAKISLFFKNSNVA